MRQLIPALLLSLPLWGSPLPLWAQSEPQPPQLRQDDADAAASDPQTIATYRLLTTVAGTIGAATVAAVLTDGWIVELMTLEGLSRVQAGSVVSNLENEGGLEAAVVLLSAVLGGIGGEQLGQWLFPDPPSSSANPALEHKLRPAAWSGGDRRAHVPF